MAIVRDALAALQPDSPLFFLAWLLACWLAIALIGAVALPLCWLADRRKP